MFIKEIVENECLKVAIPLTEPTGKARVKKRDKLSDYGETIATRQVNFSSDYYVEWQIGYDVLLKDKKKGQLTTLKDVTFKVNKYIKVQKVHMAGTRVALNG